MAHSALRVLNRQPTENIVSKAVLHTSGRVRPSQAYKCVTLPLHLVGKTAETVLPHLGL